MNEATRIMTKYPDRIPIIIKKKQESDLPEIAKKKFLVPKGMLCAELKYIISKYLQQIPGKENFSEKSLYLTITSSNYSPKASDLITEIYDLYHDHDNFLYISYSGENTLG